MPRTLAQNATYINETIKPAIKSAIEAQGVTVPSTDSFLDYADRIGEIEGGGSGYQLKDLPTGSIATVNDAAELPLNALKVSVEAWQEGTGDPSPSNVRPIHGWDSGEITVCGKNLFDSASVGVLNYRYINSGGNTAISANFKTFGPIAIKAGIYTVVFNNITMESYKRAAFYNKPDNPENGIILYAFDGTSVTGRQHYTMNVPQDGYIYLSLGVNDTDLQIELGSTATAYEPYQGKQYTQQFPQKIYGAEWDVVDGDLKQTDGYIASYNGESLPSTWISDRDVYASGTTPTIGAEVVYKLATPTTINLSPLSIRMLQGTNNLYADCGEVIEGEYFVDEGAIDVRKVDYQIGSSGSIKTTDGRVLSGFASMNRYHARPLDASGNWLDVDWSKDFEIGTAFKLTALTQTLYIVGSGNSGDYYRSPVIAFNKDSTHLLAVVSYSTSSQEVMQTNFSPAVNTWYAVKLSHDATNHALTMAVSSDFDTWSTIGTASLSNLPYHNGASLALGNCAQEPSYATDNLLIDTFNTYVKGDGVNWGAFTGVFPS